MKKDLILSLAVDGRERYSEVVKGLEKSIIDANWEGDVRIYKEWPEWVTPHNEFPYYFKYDLINHAILEGYSRIYWLDAVMRLIPGKSITDLLKKSYNGITAFHNLGHDLLPFINDTAIKNLGNPNLLDVHQCWGGAIFWDFNKPLHTNLIMDHLREQKELGSFGEDHTVREGFKAHRHDQALLSYFLLYYNIPLLPYGVIAAAKDVTDQTYIQYGD
jgi:hypothetical protein